MKTNSTLLLILASSLTVATASVASAASMPAVKTGAGNVVPECATPGRMMAFANARNSSIEDRLSAVATAYMKHGEEFGMRWDYAFFQMLVETGDLSFKAGTGKAGNVRASQNNFAAIGAADKSESFKDIETGVKAHLQHVLLYAGEKVADPVAERTRKVQEWGVLNAWQKNAKKPITFDEVTKQWAAGNTAYGQEIEKLGTSFYGEFCSKADPKPQMVQDARGGRTVAKADASAGAQLARNAIDRGKADGEAGRAALGAKAPDAPATAASSNVKILNEQGTVQTAAAAGTIKPQTGAASPGPAAAPAAGAAAKCRVWTASYGGQKSVIIRAIVDKIANFTVLDVNEGQEARETEAYIAAYAKGGQKVADFPNQTAAMEKAFQLCPEG